MSQGTRYDVGDMVKHKRTGKVVDVIDITEKNSDSPNYWVDYQHGSSPSKVKASDIKKVD